MDISGTLLLLAIVFFCATVLTVFVSAWPIITLNVKFGIIWIYFNTLFLILRLARSLPSSFLWLHSLCQQDLVCIYKLRVISYQAYGNTVPATRYLVVGSERVKSSAEDHVLHVWYCSEKYWFVLLWVCSAEDLLYVTQLF